MERKVELYRILFILLLGVICILVVRMCDRKIYDTKVIEKEVIVKDTLTIYKRDTIYVTRLVSKKERVVDTIEVPSPYYVPITQKYYKGKDYEAWISGYKPNLDSLVLFPKVEYKYITKDITRYKERRCYSLYLDGGVMLYDDKRVIPSLALRLMTPSRFSVSLGAIYIDGRMGGLFNIGFKIFETK